MRCEICGRELDMGSEPEEIPFSPAARVLDFNGQPICKPNDNNCLEKARAKWDNQQDPDWKGVRRYDLQGEE